MRFTPRSQAEKPAPAPPPPSPPPPFGAGAASLGAFAALMVGLLAVSGRSFWIDEILTVERAHQPDPASLWTMLKSDVGSEIQMPFYMAVVWLWQKFVGSGEFALRSLNLLFFVPAAALWSGGLPPRLRWPGLAVLLASPFLWRYLDEARPYAIQLSATLAAGIAAFRWHLSRNAGRPSRAWSWTFVAALFVVASSSLLGALWAGCGWLAFAFLTARSFPLLKQRDEALINSAAALFPLALYYGWTLYFGAGSTKAFGSSLTTLAFSFYELLGFAGLGPGRLELRELGPRALLGWELAPLAAYAAVLGLALWHGLRALADHRLKLPVAVLGVGAGAVVLVIWGTGLVLHFRVLGRHLAPLLPLLLVVLAAGLEHLWQKAGRSRGMALAFVLLVLGSSLSLRFAPRHESDDYRGAIAEARRISAGGRVWWNAEKIGLDIYDPLLLDKTKVLVNASTEEIGYALLPKAIVGHANFPAVVVTSKADIYDRDGHLATWLKARGYVPVRRLPAFVIWTPPPPKPP